MNVKSFVIGDKSKELLTKVFDLTTSRNHYPVKFRRLSDRLQEYALNIHANVVDANSIKADTQNRKENRYDIQTSAISNCDKFMALVEYSLHSNLLSGKTSEELTRLAMDVKYMTLSWRSKGI